MTGKRFHWDWKTGRMKDTYSSFQATKDMRLIERQINDACNSYEKQIAKLEKENEQLKHKLQQQELEYATTCNRLTEENEELKQSNERLLKMLDNVANYMQKQNKYMPIDDFVEWWNGIATKGLDDGDVE